MILSFSISIPKMLHFGFQNHRKSTLQRIKIDIDFSIDLFIDFCSTWTPFWEALGRPLGPLGVEKVRYRVNGDGDSVPSCYKYCLGRYLRPPYEAPKSFHNALNR